MKERDLIKLIVNKLQYVDYGSILELRRPPSVSDTGVALEFKNQDAKDDFTIIHIKITAPHNSTLSHP